MSRFLVVLVTAFSLSCKSSSNTTPKVIDEAYNGKSVQLKKGETITVKLGGNITTGYKWNVEAIDQNVVKIIKNEYRDNDSEKRAGKPGTRTIVLNALKNGKTELILGYRRSWEKKKPLKLFKLSIVVE